MSETKGSVTQLLESCRKGDRKAADALAELVYERLKRMARAQMGGNRARTVVPTDLVNDAFMKLVVEGEITFENRAHFFAVAAQCMRWLLSDYAKAKRRQKRGGDQLRVTLRDASGITSDNAVELCALDQALVRLAEQSPRLARVVELRCLLGLEIDETAKALGISSMTVKRDWKIAQAWLYRELSGESGNG